MTKIDFSGFSFSGEGNISKSALSKINIGEIIEKSTQFSSKKQQELTEQEKQKNDIINAFEDLTTSLNSIKDYIDTMLLKSNLVKKSVFANPGDFVNIKITDDNIPISTFVISNVLPAKHFKAVSIEAKLNDTLLDIAPELVTVTDGFSAEPRLVESMITMVPNSNIADAKNFVMHFKSTDTFQDVVNQINKSGFLRASLTKSSTDSDAKYRIYCQSLFSGVEVTFLGNASWPAFLGRPTSFGEPGGLSIDDAFIKSRSNSFEAMPGFEVTLIKPSTKKSLNEILDPLLSSSNSIDEENTINVDIRVDDIAIKSIFYALADSNNAAVEKIKFYNTKNKKEDGSGLLTNNGTLRALMKEWGEIFNASYGSKSLYEIGIETHSDLKISIIDDNIVKTLKTKQSDIEEFLMKFNKLIGGAVEIGGLFSKEIESLRQGIVLIVRNYNIVDEQLKKKKNELIQRLSALEASVIESEQLINMTETYAKQLVK